MTDLDALDEPLRVVATAGAVVILAPQNCLAITPEAAIESAERLMQAAKAVSSGEASPTDGMAD